MSAAEDRIVQFRSDGLGLAPAAYARLLAEGKEVSVRVELTSITRQFVTLELKPADGPAQPTSTRLRRAVDVA